jgi:hypothetical protein
MKESRNGIRILLPVIFTIAIAIVIATFTIVTLEDSKLYERSNISTPVAVTATPSPTAPIVPTPEITTMIDNGYVNTSKVILRNYPEIKDSTYVKVIPIGTAVNIIGACKFSNRSWYKIKGGNFICSEFVTLDDRVSFASRGESLTRGFVTKLTAPSNLSNAHIEYLLKGGGMIGLSDTILYCEKKFELNAFFIISVGKHESGNGSSPLSRNRNNLYGFNAWGDVNKNATRYDSKNDSVYSFSELIRNNYLNKGLTNIHTIGKVYCESGDWSELIEGMTKDSLWKLKSFPEIR